MIPYENATNTDMMQEAMVLELEVSTVCGYGTATVDETKEYLQIIEE